MNGKMKKVYIETNGCAVQRNETQRYAKFFRLNGWKEIDNPSDADLILMTTCGVVQWTEDKAIEAIKRLVKGKSKEIPMIIGGCLPKINPERIKKISPNLYMFPPTEPEFLDRFINAKISIKDIRFNINPVREHSFGDPEISYSDEEKEQLKISSYFDKKFNSKKFSIIYNYLTKGKHLWKEEGLFEVKVASGCAGHCSYCATKLAIGDIQSSDPEVIFNEVKEGVKQGFKKILLTGDEVGFYGIDLGISIVDLIKKLDSIKGDFKIGLRYVHPNALLNNYKELKKYFESGRIYYFCCAIQSGSNKILKLMNRSENIEKISDIIQDLDKNYPEVIKHTQIIVGFPNETIEDFQKTLEILKKCNFDYITSTAYADRYNTKAINLKNHVTSEEIKRRYGISLNFISENRNKQFWRRIQRELIKQIDKK